ncbi:MAG: HAMP domain-containing sensor histidine kinase [Paracoccaceae bacterium]|jgi:signal transduction histidine kinase|nr:HAMP domain-containing sensor histidine kinase [Paracoccaceae bacterium]
MSRDATPRKYRPPIRLILMVMLLIAFATPLVGLFFLRIIENQLARRTEAELIGQTAALAASYSSEIKRAGIEKVWLGKEAKGVFRDSLTDPYLPLPPTIDLAIDRIHPPRPVPEQALSPPASGYLIVGQTMAPIVQATVRRTLAGVYLLDAQGRIIYGPDAEIGMSLDHVEEVKAALDGEFASTLRTRLREIPPPWVYSFTKGASLRVFTAFPVIVDGRTAGVVYASRSPRHVLQMMAAESEKLYLAGVVMALALAGFGYIASRAITRPIRALTERTRLIASGDPNALKPLKSHGTAEVAELSEAFLRTARQLHDRGDDIASFAAHVSHELKSPLTAIQGAAELIRDNEDIMTGEEREGFLNNIIKDSERLTLLVRRLLELARADKGEDEATGTDVASLAQLLDDRTAMKVVVNDPDQIALKISEEKLAIILTNMVDNSARHGASELTVTVRRKGAEAEITVADNGEGVSPRNEARLFEPFFTTARTEGGTGMGLPIIQAMLVARDGSIEFVGGKGGAVFLVRLGVVG